MKYYLVKFNHPVLITTPNTTNDCIVYGFVVPRGRDDDEYDIPCYVGYIAAMHEWSAGRETEFTSSPLSYWLDKDGIEHKPTDEWSHEIEERCRKRLGLDCTSLLIETEEEICSSSGMDDNLIVCKWKMDELSEMAEQDDIYYVITFNRPIWLPARLVCPEEKGYSHIYGVVVEEEPTQATFTDVEYYLGYLAMIEEYCLNGVTPSGYVPADEDNCIFWIDRGEEYRCNSDMIKKEALLCAHKHNLKINNSISMTLSEIQDGVTGDFITSQHLYEMIN